MRIVEKLCQQIAAVIEKLPDHMLPVDYDVSLAMVPVQDPSGMQSMQATPVLIFAIPAMELGKKVITTTPVGNLFATDDEIEAAVRDILDAMFNAKRQAAAKVIQQANGLLPR
jgi:hypothetical protein